MGFEYPLAFWGLSALAALFIFSLWRQRPTRAGVSSVVLWRRIPDRTPPVRAARQPEISASLVLQALAVAAMVAALAGPFVTLRGSPPRRVAVVIDTSARMKARTRSGRTRLDLARTLALLEVSRLRAEDTASLYWNDLGPRHWSGPGDELAGRLREIVATDFAVDVSVLVEEAAEETRRRGGGEVWYISDRSSPRPGVREFLAGEPSDNVGVVECSIEGNEIFARLEGHGGPHEVTLVVRGDDRELVREKVKIDSITSWSRSLEMGKMRRVTLALESDDQLAVDNAAAAARFRDGIIVALSGFDHPLLERALQSVPGVVLRRGGTAPITVLFRTVHPAPSEGLVVYVDPAVAPEGFRFGAELRDSKFVLHDHPLTAHLKAAEVSALIAREIAEGGEPLIQADGRTVAAIRRDGPLTRIVLAFELGEGWTSHPSFPMFWQNVVAYSGAAGSWRTIRTGRVERLPQEVTSVRAADSNARFTFDPRTGRFLAGSTGEYLARTSEGETRFDVSLLDSTQTNTEGISREASAAAGDRTSPVRHSLSAYTCVLALLFVLAAWLCDRRR